MTGIEQPIYLVAFRDTWVGTQRDPKRGIVAFGTAGEAIKHAKECAEDNDHMLALYRVVEFKASGEVLEA